MTDLALFDSRGCFVIPSDEAVALASADWTEDHLAAFENLCEAARADAAVAAAIAELQIEAGAAFRTWIAARAAAAAAPRPSAVQVAKSSMGRR